MPEPTKQTDPDFLDSIFAEAKGRFVRGAEAHKDNPFYFQFDTYRDMEEELLDIINYAAMQLGRIRKLKMRAILETPPTRH